MLQRRFAIWFSTATRRRQGWSRLRDIRILIHRGRTVRTSSRDGERNVSNWYSTISTCIIRRTRRTSKYLSPLSFSLSLRINSVITREGEREREENVFSSRKYIYIYIYSVIDHRIGSVESRVEISRVAKVEKLLCVGENWYVDE